MTSTRKRILAIAAVAVLLAAGAGYWFIALDGPNGPEARMMALCETAPSPEQAESAMRADGWIPLPADRTEALIEATALFHVASRFSLGGSDFDAAEERAVLDSRASDAREKLQSADTLAFGRTDSDAMAVIAPIDGVPAGVGCDLFLTDGTRTDWFGAMVAPFQTNQRDWSWAFGWSTAGQQPRPGLWVANLVVIDPANASDFENQQLVDFLGRQPDYLVLSRNSFRGEVPN